MNMEFKDFETLATYLEQDYTNKEKYGDFVGTALSFEHVTFPSGDYDSWTNLFRQFKNLKSISFTNCTFRQFKFYMNHAHALKHITFELCTFEDLVLHNTPEFNHKALSSVVISLGFCTLRNSFQLVSSSENGHKTNLSCDDVDVRWFNLIMPHRNPNDMVFYELNLKKLKADRVNVMGSPHNVSASLSADIDSLPIMQAFFPGIPLKELTF